MERTKRALALLLALALAAALTACGEHEPEPETETLRVAWESVDGKFSPFYAETTADRDAMELTQIRLLYSDRSGLVVYQGIEGETIPYNGVDYTYYGPADLTVTENADGTVWYDFTLREDLRFSDGTPLTADDLIFSLYVLCDPTYNGPNKLKTMPIQGLKDYRQGGTSHISGIQKTGEYSLRIAADRLDVSMIYYLGSVYIAPLHYYGDADSYDYEQDSFGFPKGDLSGVREKTEQPLGAGPYRLVAYQKDEVTYEANEGYYLGAPKIGRLSLRSYENSNEKLEELTRGNLDIGWFSSGFGIDQELIDSLEGTVAFLYTDEICNPAYQYIGLNPKTVNVAGDPGSGASKCLRRALATVIAACREDGLAEAREQGLLTQAHVIESPISNTSWAALQPGEARFYPAFSTDVNGAPIYTGGMTEEERRAAVAKAALGFFGAAGYTVEDGRLTAAPEGAALDYEVQLGCILQSNGDCLDPVWLTMQRAREILSTLGMELTVVNTFEREEMEFPAVGECGLWGAVWGDADLAGLWVEGDHWNDWYAVTDPAPHFREICYAGTGGGSSGALQGIYGISDPELDRLILEAESTTDQTRRRALYRRCLEILQDWACEVPFTQERDTVAVAAGRLQEGTMPEDITGHYGWMREIHRLDLGW